MMKLGLLTSILQYETLEEAVDFAAANGLRCLEVACWRYAGVCHIDMDTLTDGRIAEITHYCNQKQVEISSLGYYPNPLDRDPGKRSEAVNHLKKLIVASAKLGVNMVTTFIGRMQDASVEENLEEMKLVWPELLSLAEAHNVKIAIENCPMLFGAEQWPGGQNLFTSPSNWKKIFDALPSGNLGINYDPSHFIWQMIDYIQPIYEFRDKIFHVHIKDIKVYPEKLKQVGIMAYPLDYMAPKLPGLGDVDWGAYISALMDIGYDGYICLEIEDKSFEKSREDIVKSILLSKRYIENYMIA